jgi:4-nitrophenyl phosphatase
MAANSEFPELPCWLRRRLEHQERALLVDIQGVLVDGETACPGARRLLGFCRRCRIPLCLISNMACQSRQEHADALRRVGLAVDASQVFTLCAVAQYILEWLGLMPTSVLRLGPCGFQRELVTSGLRLVGNDADVVIARHLDPGSPDLARVRCTVRRVTRLVATSTDVDVPSSSSGTIPGVGTALCELWLQGLADTSILDKPNSAFVQAVVTCGLLNESKPILVGHNADTDVRGASSALILAVLVKSAMTTPPVPSSGHTWAVDSTAILWRQRAALRKNGTVT